MKNRNKTFTGFTLVELLVVIGIIALLISILLPALGKARQAAQEAQCMSALHQWGIGFQMYADQNKGALAADGPSGLSSDPIGNTSGTIQPINSNAYWFNAVPPLVGQKSYVVQMQQDVAGTKTLAHAGDNSVFVCPTAGEPASNVASEISPDGHYFLINGVNLDPTLAIPSGPNNAGLPVGSARPFKCYMSYVFNSKLFGSENDGVDREAWKMSQLQPAGSVVLMVEKMVRPKEYQLPAQQSAGSNIGSNGFVKNIGQPKACWTRFTTRHRGGGFLLFADGHVAWFGWKQVQPSLDPTNSNVADANHPGTGVVWNPLTSVGNKSGGD